MLQCDIYDLEVGDRFMEDTYPETYRVLRIEPAKDFTVVVAECEEDGTHSEWGYNRVIGNAYAPCIIKL